MPSRDLLGRRLSGSAQRKQAHERRDREAELMEQPESPAEARFRANVAALGPPPAKPIEIAVYLTNMASLCAQSAIADDPTDERLTMRRRHVLEAVRVAAGLTERAIQKSTLIDIARRIGLKPA